ncbi:hypothetical protein [Selenihalanaerobacter shriftii]|uniref:Uncharacterized protein n=1 Tax=Selenihalanaerobacter shriftii TaxID=142842 RepID=A0A1T4NWG9_9FIRM|nr:hypothetical protein [Selenihalanaerobacter shriftii]SJZ83624.1 hypothetical protein SAMN02745118_01962 [Selenihalanaerobacter shriftii]
MKKIVALILLITSFIFIYVGFNVDKSIIASEELLSKKEEKNYFRKI